MFSFSFISSNTSSLSTRFSSVRLAVSRIAAACPVNAANGANCDEVLEELNEKLNIISANIGTEQLVDITYFVQDERKAGGEYVTHSGIVKRIDLYRRAVIMADATIIPIEDISQIESNLFSDLE